MTLAPFSPPQAAALTPTPLTTLSPRTLRLPDGVRVVRGLPRAEAAVFTVVVPLLAVPLLLATMGALPVAVVAVALTSLVGGLCRARRTAVGHDWIAERTLLRYRVTHHSELHAAELIHNQHGGRLVLHTSHGHTHSIRHPDLQQVELRRAVGDILRRGRADLGRGVERALGLQDPRELSAQARPSIS